MGVMPVVILLGVSPSEFLKAFASFCAVNLIYSSLFRQHHHPCRPPYKCLTMHAMTIMHALTFLVTSKRLTLPVMVFMRVLGRKVLLELHMEAAIKMGHVKECQVSF